MRPFYPTNSVVRALEIFIFMILLGSSTLSLGESSCGGVCNTSNECPANQCKLCDPDVGRCVTCCTYDEESCPSSEGCVPTSSGATFECRDVAGESCTGVPEIPHSSKPWVWGGMLVLAAGFGAIARLKTLRNSKR